MWAINPNDWEAIDLLTGSDDHFLNGSTFNDVAERKLWQVPIVLPPHCRRHSHPRKLVRRPAEAAGQDRAHVV